MNRLQGQIYEYDSRASFHGQDKWLGRKSAAFNKDYPLSLILEALQKFQGELYARRGDLLSWGRGCWLVKVRAKASVEVPREVSKSRRLGKIGINKIKGSIGLLEQIVSLGARRQGIE